MRLPPLFFSHSLDFNVGATAETTGGDRSTVPPTIRKLFWMQMLLLREGDRYLSSRRLDIPFDASF